MISPDIQQKIAAAFGVDELSGGNQRISREELIQVSYTWVVAVESYFFSPVIAAGVSLRSRKQGITDNRQHDHDWYKAFAHKGLLLIPSDRTSRTEPRDYLQIGITDTEADIPILHALHFINALSISDAAVVFGGIPIRYSIMVKTRDTEFNFTFRGDLHHGNHWELSKAIVATIYYLRDKYNHPEVQKFFEEEALSRRRMYTGVYEAPTWSQTFSSFFRGIASYRNRR